eukprot:TRINITY_DN9679_c0_g1_i2.p1 TRINITY_DN9679_c0_g1~~TRINITY_DN9679_c0_g1_i2.p1  ORF type:complete len:178 (+),score=53.57 TRINITY_DN9679_c0_g1_i2:117-650(+)
MAANAALGAEVALTTIQNEIVQGLVYALDDKVQIIGLRQPNSNTATTDPSVFDLRWVKYDHIKSCKVTKEPVDKPPAVGYIDPEEGDARLRKTLQSIDLEMQAYNKDVSAQVQLLFKLLARANPCRWKGTSIVMFDKIEVAPPYTADSCKMLTKDGTDTLVRVKQLLAQFRVKAGLQ